MIHDSIGLMGDYGTELGAQRLSSMMLASYGGLEIISPDIVLIKKPNPRLIVLPNKYNPKTKQWFYKPDTKFIRAICRYSKTTLKK